MDAPVRRALLKRFPFGVFFVPGSETDAGVILAVVDLRHDPEVMRGAQLR